MARRAGSVLATLAAATAIVLPAVGAAGQVPAAAAVRQGSSAPVGVAITGLSPQWAAAGSTITVTGTVTNTSQQQASHLTVQLLASATPISSVTELELNAAQLDGLADVSLPGRTWQTSGELAPGGVARWSISLPASAIGMTAFGVYPIAAQVQSALATPLATSTTYLPYEPAKKGAEASTRPAAEKISWAWPLIDSPLLNEPWQGNCKGPQPAALAASITSGRLSQLLGAAGTDSGNFGITWAIDPALLANVKALSTCGGSQPQWAKAATSWLARVRTATAGRPVMATAYGDPNIAALIGAGHAADVQRSAELGRDVAGDLLQRNLSPVRSKGTAPALSRAAALSWPAGGISGFPTLENFPGMGVSTLLLSSAALPSEQANVFRTPDGAGSYMNVLLASQSLTQLLGSAGSTTGSVFGTAQQFLAETALLAEYDPADPIIVAPPQRWDPPAGLAAEVLADTASAPWLKPVELTSLTRAGKVPVVPTLPATAQGNGAISKPERRELAVLGREVARLQNIEAQPDSDLYLAMATIESSAWQGAAKSTAKDLLATVADRITAEQKSVRIDAENRVTLGGLKGSVPVSITNDLGFAVKVRLAVDYSQATGIKITADPPGLITVGPHTAETIRLRVQAAEVGSTTVTMSLVSPDGLPTAATSERMTIQATQVGVLGMIIFAAALGVLLIASAARAIRRGRPVPAEGLATAGAPADDHDQDGGAGPAGPDSVMAERTELGTAGTPGP